MSLARRALRMLITEWRYTYRSARRDAWSRKVAARMFGREVAAGILQLSHP